MWGDILTTNFVLLSATFIVYVEVSMYVCMCARRAVSIDLYGDYYVLPSCCCVCKTRTTSVLWSSVSVCIRLLYYYFMFTYLVRCGWCCDTETEVLANTVVFNFVVLSNYHVV